MELEKKMYTEHFHLFTIYERLRSVKLFNHHVLAMLVTIMIIHLIKILFGQDLRMIFFSKNVWTQPPSYWPTIGCKVAVSIASLPTCSGNQISNNSSLGFCDVREA